MRTPTLDAVTWRVALFAVVLALSPGVARTQAAPGAPRTESGAFARSLWGTVIPVAVGVVVTGAAGDSSDVAAGVGALAFTGGLLVGPSLGYFYAGRPGRAWAGIGVRTVGFVLFVGAIGASINCILSETGSGTCSKAGDLLLAGTVVTFGSAIYDIATVRGAVRRRNGPAHAVSVGVTPMYSRSRRAPGLAVGIRF